jgi:hypothetical protein
MNTIQHNSVFKVDCYISKNAWQILIVFTLQRWQVSSSEIETPNNVTSFFYKLQLKSLNLSPLTGNFLATTNSPPEMLTVKTDIASMWLRLSFRT